MADTLAAIRTTKDVMSGVCVEGEEWRACIDRCEDHTEDPAGMAR